MTDSSDDTFTQGPGKRPPLTEESHATIGDVLGLVAHDLRNPLAALSSNVGFLGMVGDNLSQDAREAISDLQLSIEAMGRIVDSLELLCHDLKGQEASPSLSIVVSNAVRAVQSQAERAAESHGVSLEIDLGGCEQDRFSGSEGAFSRALAALVHNALTVAPTRSTVRLSVASNDQSVVFRVEDDGAELAPELADAALSAGGQVAVKTEIGARYSRGLGLYVVARSAELAGVKLRKVDRENGSALELVAKSAV